MNNFPRVEIPGVDKEQGALAADLMEAGRVENAERIRFGIKRVVSLRMMGKHTYNGTVSAKTKARRRAANKAARLARRANR